MAPSLRQYSRLQKSIFIIIRIVFLVLFFTQFRYFLNYCAQLLPQNAGIKTQAIAIYLHSIICNSFLLCFYFIIYSLKIPFIEQFRITQNPWMWEKVHAIDNQSSNSSTDSKEVSFLKNTLTHSYLNIICISALLSAIDCIFSEDHPLNIQQIPNLTEVIWQISFFTIIEDFSFYWSHRLLHSRIFYRFHKIHHEHYHSSAFSVFHSHPVDFTLNVVSSISGVWILGKQVHLTTVLFWLTLRILETYEGHSGYEFPWSMFRLLPFGGQSVYHDFHHSHNSGNYASFFTYLDTLFGTNKEFQQFIRDSKNIKNSVKSMTNMSQFPVDKDK